MKRSSAYVDKDVKIDHYVVGHNINNLTSDPEPPVNPGVGDLWVDMDDETPNQVGTYIKSNSIGTASFDPIQPADPVVGDLWIDPNVFSDPGVNAPIDMQGAPYDIPIVMNKVTCFNYVNASSIPLNIATELGIYEIYILNEPGATIANTLPTALLPNNGVAVGEFISNNGATDVVADSFLLSEGNVINCKIVVSTFTTSKGITFHALTETPSLLTTLGGCKWDNLTTPWSSLGTLVFPFPQTGRVIVKRII